MRGSSRLLVQPGSQVIALDGSSAKIVSRSIKSNDDVADCDFGVLENSMVLLTDDDECHFPVISALAFERPEAYAPADVPVDLSGLPIVDCVFSSCLDLRVLPAQ